MDAETIAEAYGLKKSGRQWRGPCPVHGGTGEAFVVTDREDGTPLVHCHAGCGFRDIVQELKANGLWPERERQPGPPPRKVRWAEWLVPIYEAARRNGESLSPQDHADYRKARAVLEEAREAKA